MLARTNAESLDSKRLSKLTPADYDQLAFGVIELDRNFIVRTYNQSESALARRDPAETVGKHFFRDVAPCTDVDEFRGRIEALMSADVDADVRFDYTFAFPWGSRRVRIRAMRGTDSTWVFVTPLRSFDAG